MKKKNKQEIHIRYGGSKPEPINPKPKHITPPSQKKRSCACCKKHSSFKCPYYE